MAALCPDSVTDILLCLPVKSLLRFRCLSSSIRTQIDSPDFANNHLNRSIQTKTHQKLIIGTSSADFYAADFDDGLRDAFPLKNPLKSPHGCTLIRGSCNGLILLGIFDEYDQPIDLAIWNPFTRRFRKLPFCPVQTHVGFIGFEGFGLGYDSALDDYKAVIISLVRDSLQVWVFNLKSNYWRRCRDLQLVRGGFEIAVGIFANGALYWDWGEKTFSVGFDLAKEVFFKLPQLSDCGGTAKIYVDLMDFGGHLCLPVIDDKHQTIEVYLYVSDEVGDDAGRSWRRKYIVERKENIWYNDFLGLPLAYSEEGHRILLKTYLGIFWYNLESKTAERVESPGMPQDEGYHYLDHCLVYWESLVSFGDDTAFDGAAEA